MGRTDVCEFCLQVFLQRRSEKSKLGGTGTAGVDRNELVGGKQGI